jgi:hypothetical protein
MRAPLLALVALLALALPSLAQTALTLDCPSVTGSAFTGYNATHYAGGILSCATVTSHVVLPNGTVLTPSLTSCSSGLHQFQFTSTLEGVYEANASASTAYARCAITRLPTAETVHVPDLPLALALATGLLAGALSARLRPPARKP